MTTHSQDSDPAIAPSTIDIDVMSDTPLWHEHDETIETLVRGTLSLCMFHLKHLPLLEGYETIEISCLLTDDEHIQQLNNDFRQKDKPTNVLSFATCDSKTKVFEMNEELMLGDIILSYQTLVKEAKEQNKSFENHFRHLLIHGLLHLLGYDHMNDEEAEIMEALEVKLLKIFNIKDPYQTITE